MEEITYVMTPAEWGKPIDVAEKWIHFVDDNVRDSELTGFPFCHAILMARSE